MEILGALILGAICGLVGAYAMTGFMGRVSAAYSERVDMIVALGSYFKGSLDGAEKLGRTIHTISGVVFGMVYFAIMQGMGALVFPHAFFLGIGFGFFHGLIVSYALMFYASERHPIEIYRKATLEQGLLHLVGHLIFGGVVGLIGGLVTRVVYCLL
ncbi:MAG: hypothetical protein ACPG3X_02100 [Opitutales bacterium]